MRTMTIVMALVAGVACGDDPKVRAAWAWATAKAEPAKTAWVVESKADHKCTCSPQCPCPCSTGGACTCGTAKECRLEVTLPANATLYIDGKPALNQSGTFRTFVSPPITGECAYQLSVAIPNEYGQSATVKVWPGVTSRHTFYAVEPTRLPPMQFRGRPMTGPLLNGGNCGPGG
jgi:hypothetical protein